MASLLSLDSLVGRLRSALQSSASIARFAEETEALENSIRPLTDTVSRLTATTNEWRSA